MDRRQFVRTVSGIAGIGVIGAGPVAATPPGQLVNAQVQSSGAIVATDDDFLIAGQSITVDGGTYYQDGGNSYVIYNDGYSGTIRDNTITVTSVPSISYPNGTYAVRVDGGTVTVGKNVIDAIDGIDGRFFATGFFDGTTAKVAGNEITGAHRIGVLAVGNGTSAEISRNTIVGPGPRSTGWADNGVQISGGATGSVKDNDVNHHWYAPNTFVSSGLILYGDDVVAQRNTFVDNDLGVGFAGARNNVIHNTVEVTYSTTSTQHYGVYELGGVDNGIRQNAITTAASNNGLIGIIVLGDNAKLIRNELSGWDDPIYDGGDDTKLPKPFEPDS